MDVMQAKGLDSLACFNTNGVKELSLQGKELQHIPEAVAKMGELEVLTLSNNNLKNVTHEIFNLQNLKVLQLAGNNLEQLPKNISRSKKLIKLDVSSNQLTKIPDEIEELEGLQELALHFNSLTEIPGGIRRLKKLTKLRVSFNHLTGITDDIEQLEKLQELHLMGNNLTSLPPGICQLRKLTNLNVSENQLTRVPDDLGEMEELQELDLRRNSLTHLPLSVCNLKKLTKLDVAENELTMIPDDIALLSELRQLYLYANMLSKLPLGVFQLSKLITLDVSFNQLKELPPGISQLKKMIRLDASFNQLSTIPEGIEQLQGLQELDLRENSLTEIPPTICQAKSLSRLKVCKNPLQRPPLEVANQGLTAIYEYYLDIRQGDALHYKIVLLGSSGAGKTSLAKTLVNNKPSCVQDEERTVVLETRKWKAELYEKVLNISLVDFGGNQWYKIVHHLFLDKDALILLVVNLARYSEDLFHEEVRSWLDVVMARVLKASVLLVGTHIDCLESEEEIRHRKEKVLQDVLCLVNEASYLRVHIIAEQMFAVSSKYFNGIDILKETLLKFVSRHGKVVPSRWVEIYRELQTSDIDQGQRFLTLDRAKEVIERRLQDDTIEPLGHGEAGSAVRKEAHNYLNDSHIDTEKAKRTETILTFFHETGSLLWYKQSRGVRNFVFVRPQFVADLMIAVFSERLEAESLRYRGTFKYIFTKDSFEKAKDDLLRQGIMSYKLLKGLWNHLHLEGELFSAMAELFIQLDLCYLIDETDGDQCLRIPWFLTKDAPETPGIQKMMYGRPLEGSYRLCLKYVYPARCPPPLYHLFVVRLHRHVHDIKSRHDWKDGVYALVRETEMLVQRSDHCTEKVILVSIEGSDLVEVWTVLVSCHRELEGLMSDWVGLRWECWILCPHCIRMGITPPGIFDAKQLKTQCPRGRVTCNRHDELLPSCLIYPVKTDYLMHQKVLQKYNIETKRNGVGVSNVQESLQTPLLKTGKPLQKELHRVAQDVCALWKALGRELGLGQGLLSQIEADNSGTYEQCYVMLKTWTQNEAQTTYEDLARALLAIHKEDIAFKHCSLYKMETGDVNSLEKWPYMLNCKDGRPSQLEILLLARAVLEGSWKQLGRALNLLDSDLSEIEHDCTDLFDKSYSMLNKWMQKEASEATYGSLAKGLEEVRRSDLVQEFCCLKRNGEDPDGRE